eukprot:TRINITY_DN15930_c0_g1_i2.p2 TRINITY_DN15930_c0_g1~~TRINITY_DN15930_c0_g1_i2.p2  ORF type:complete len:344 (+),score=99.04 TRINITY_DN15930_c0_g1_i2:269-1300(+)
MLNLLCSSSLRRMKAKNHKCTANKKNTEPSKVVPNKRLDEITKEKEKMRKENIEFSKNLVELNKEKSELNITVSNLNEEKNTLMKKIEELKREKGECSKKLSEARDSITEYETKVKFLHDEIGSSNAKAAVVIKEKELLVAQLKELETHSMNIKNEMVILSNEIIVTKEQLDDALKQKEELSVMVDKFAKANIELTENVTKLEKEIKELVRQREQKENQVAELEKKVLEANSERSLKELTEFKAQLKEINKEKELTLQSTEYHLKENSKILKKYSLENARLIVRLGKMGERVKKCAGEYCSMKREVKALLAAFMESFRPFNLIVQGKVLPLCKLQNKNYLNFT